MSDESVFRITKINCILFYSKDTKKGNEVITNFELKLEGLLNPFFLVVFSLLLGKATNDPHKLKIHINF